MQALFSWLAHYGDAALFVLLMFGIAGIPIPDETLLFFCGYLIFKGRMRFDSTLLTAFAGSCCGISLSYFVGRKYGRRVIHHYGPCFHLTPARVYQVNHWFHRIGGWVLTVGYFIPGVRHFTALVAGIAHFKYPKFAFFAYFGAAIWVTTFLTLGYAAGDQWERASEVAHRYILIGAGVLAAAGFAWWWSHLRRLRLSRTR